jgi:hypothetical protein
MTAMNNMTDKELDKLLGAAEQPSVPKGFAERLQTKLEAEAMGSVVAFQQRKMLTEKPRWLIGALPLAASLLLGVYVGAADALPESLNGIETNLLAGGAESISDIGIEDMESFLDGDLT